MMGGDDDDGDAIAETQETSDKDLFQRCDSSDMEILAQLISACLTVTAWDSDSSPYCVPVPVLLVGIGTTVLVPVLATH